MHRYALRMTIRMGMLQWNPLDSGVSYFHTYITDTETDSSTFPPFASYLYCSYCSILHSIPFICLKLQVGCGRSSKLMPESNHVSYRAGDAELRPSRIRSLSPSWYAFLKDLGHKKIRNHPKSSDFQWSIIIFHSFSHVFSHVFRKTSHASPTFPTISGLRSGGSPEHRRSRKTSLPEIMMWGVSCKMGGYPKNDQTWMVYHGRSLNGWTWMI